MTYDTIEASVADGRPYYLYQFVDGAEVWRFTSRAQDWISAGSDGETITWEAAAISHGDVVQTSEIERGRLELTWPLSHPFARRFLAPLGNQPVTLTIFRGHEQVLGETVAHWKGRVVGAEDRLRDTGDALVEPVIQAAEARLGTSEEARDGRQ